MWICSETGSAIRDEGDGGSCGRHFHPKRAHAEGFAAAVWQALTAPAAHTNGHADPVNHATAPISVGFSLPNPLKGEIGIEKKAASPGFRLLSDMLLDVETEQSWLVDGLLPTDGTSLWGAKPKVGKSSILRSLARAVATGSPFLGRRVTRGKVLLISLEDSQRRVLGHFRLMGGVDHYAGSVAVHVGSAPVEDGAGWLAQLVVGFEPVLVVVDTVGRLLRFRDVNDYAEVTRKLEPVSELARSRSCHIALAHHLGKTERSDDGDTVLGSTALFGSVDTLVVLRKEQDASRTIATIQRDGDDLPVSRLVLDDYQRAVLGSTMSELAGVRGRHAVLDAIGGDLVLENDLRAAAGIRVDECSRVLRDLVAEGTVVRYGSGRRGDPYRYGLRAGAPSAEEDDDA